LYLCTTGFLLRVNQPISTLVLPLLAVLELARYAQRPELSASDFDRAFVVEPLTVSWGRPTQGEATRAKLVKSVPSRNHVRSSMAFQITLGHDLLPVGAAKLEDAFAGTPLRLLTAASAIVADGPHDD